MVAVAPARMRQPTDPPLAAGVAPSPSANVVALMRRLAVTGLLLAGITVLATIALAA